MLSRSERYLQPASRKDTFMQDVLGVQYAVEGPSTTTYYNGVASTNCLVHQPGPTASFSFVKLPAEVRREAYKLALMPEKSISHPHQQLKHGNSKSKAYPVKINPLLLATCVFFTRSHAGCRKVGTVKSRHNYRRRPSGPFWPTKG